jgi:2-keto-4-pentenoate hydratase/2-oxohepta-3-ene-1,7-dioic acid hydratase in catechol pathway
MTGETVHLDCFSAKCLNSSTPMGPYVVQTADVIDALKAKRIRMVTRVNGEVHQDAEIKDMIFDFSKIVAFASSRVKFSPGDRIATGTLQGIGFAIGQFLNTGDVVEVKITGLPVLRPVVV